MNSISAIFKDFVDFCQLIKSNTPRADRISSMFGLPVSIKIEDLVDYFEYRNDKITICVPNLKTVPELKKKYPKFNFTSPRQCKTFDADILVVMEYSKLGDNEKRYCEFFNRQIVNGCVSDFIIVYIG